MKQQSVALRRIVRPIVVAIATCVLLVGCSEGGSPAKQTVTDSNLAQKVQDAKTSADHYQLAEYFEARAKTAEQNAAKEHQLLGHYERRWRHGDSAGSDVGRHIENLVEAHNKSATHNRTMADWHRRMGQRDDDPSTADE